MNKNNNNFKNEMITRFQYLYDNQSFFKEHLDHNELDLYRALEYILLSDKPLTKNEHYYYVEYLKNEFKTKDVVDKENLVTILTKIYNYINNQRKDEKNKIVKLQVIKEYLRIIDYQQEIPYTKKSRYKEDVGVTNNDFINTFAYGPEYFYYEALHLDEEDKKLIKRI